MLAGSSFNLVCSFKVAGGNGFQDSFFQLSQRAITDTQVTSLSLSSFARRVTMFVQPSARMVTTKLQLLLTFLFSCLSRLAKICTRATLVSLETRQAFYKLRLQEQPCYFPNSTLHAKHVCVRFGLCSKPFLSLQSNYIVTIETEKNALSAEVAIPKIWNTKLTFSTWKIIMIEKVYIHISMGNWKQII